MSGADRFSVHAWGGDKGEECISCGVTVADCDDFCDAEQFCPRCFAGMESSEHHEKCIATEDELRWHYGPTYSNPDPGRMWCYDDGGEVYTLDGGYVCTRCNRQSDR